VFEGFGEGMTEDEEREAMVLGDAATDASWHANSTKSALHALDIAAAAARKSADANVFSSWGRPATIITCASSYRHMCLSL
jgi:hypothetical protein